MMWNRTTTSSAVEQTLAVAALGAATTTAAVRPQYSMSLAGLLEASITVLLTTLEDCVWLIPFVAQAPTTGIALAHATIFIATFVSCAVGASLVALFVDNLVRTQSNVILESTGAIICWLLAGFFYYQSYRKQQQKQKRRRQNQEQDQQLEEESSSLVIAAIGEPSTDNTVDTTLLSFYGTVSSAKDEEEASPPRVHPEPVHLHDGSSLTLEEGGALVMASENGKPTYLEPATTTTKQQAATTTTTTTQPWVIISLTILGSLDEISYFPALIVGQIFTVAELICATLIASLLILCLVDVLKTRCNVCLYILDQIPLYAVIAVFALLLSIQVLLDLIMAE